MSDCVCGFNPPSDCNPDCERCQLEQEVERLKKELNQYIGGEANEYGQSQQRIVKLQQQVERLEGGLDMAINLALDASDCGPMDSETVDRILAKAKGFRTTPEGGEVE